MNNYQIELFKKFENYRPDPKYPVYPPYHKGLYLEDFFIKWFIENDIKSERYFIPVSWTTCYVDNCYQGLQHLLNELDNTKKYFTVAQHDDAIREKLPIDTISFNAGGNGGGIPIPLVCSPLELKTDTKKDVFCSFVGSVTHPIRNIMCQILSNNPKYIIGSKNWSPSVSNDDFNTFINLTSRSIFSLCPRGYGRSSFRLYEVMQLNSIPVFIYDERWLPFEDEINWNEFSVLIHISQMSKIDNILSSYTPEKIQQMQDKLYKIWQDNFTMESICQKIIKRI